MWCAWSPARRRPACRGPSVPRWRLGAPGIYLPIRLLQIATLAVCHCVRVRSLCACARACFALRVGGRRVVWGGGVVVDALYRTQVVAAVTAAALPPLVAGAARSVGVTAGLARRLVRLDGAGAEVDQRFGARLLDAAGRGIETRVLPAGAPPSRPPAQDLGGRACGFCRWMRSRAPRQVYFGGGGGSGGGGQL